MKLFPKTISLLAIVSGANLSSATDLYNLDFTAPEVGTYDVIFGAPAVQPSVGPFTDALVFHAVAGYDQIRLPITTPSLRYDIQFDAFTHGLLNTKYGFSFIADLGPARSITFHGGLDQFDAEGFGNLGGFSDDHVYHFHIVFDYQANLRSVGIGNEVNVSLPLNAPGLSAVRFSMNPIFGGTVPDAPGTYAAIDNLVITAIPEPTLGALAAVGLVLLSAIRKRDPRP